MANSTWRANSSTGLPLTTSLPNSLPCPAMRNSTNPRRGRRGADGQRLAKRQPQKKMSGTSKAKGKGSFVVGKNRDEMKKADHDWANNPRWKGISRSYSVSDVRRLQGNVIIEHTLARRGAEKLWSLLQAEPFINALIEAGAAGVHLEDQRASEKKCGHMGGKVLVPTRAAIAHLIAARLAADVCDVPTLILARTDANAAALLTTNADERDREFLTGERTVEGFFRVRTGLDQAIARGLSYAPFADLIWCETSQPNLAEAKKFAEGIHAQFPGKLLAYNCSPSFNWRKKLDSGSIAKFQRELGAMGYKFQFVTLAGFHALNYSMFQLARGYRDRGMEAYADLQEAEFAAEKHGYSATKHQHEVGAGYFDDVAQVIAAGLSSTTALRGSTEQEQFH